MVYLYTYIQIIILTPMKQFDAKGVILWRVKKEL